VVGSFLGDRPGLPSLATNSHQRSIHHPTQLPCTPHKLVRPPDTQHPQHHTHLSVCKVVLRARASARCCAPVAPMLFERRLCGLCEHRDRNSVMTIIIIDCVWLFLGDRPGLPSLVPISHQRVSISIQHPTQLPCAPHKLVRTPGTQLRQYHTYRSVCKVVLRARASARCCAPASPILLLERLRGWRKQRNENSMVAMATIDCVWLFSRRPTRLALTATQRAASRLDLH
jgi:hypothetical protein